MANNLPLKKKAVVLLSGGIDSSTALYIARDMGYECFPLIFDYGQRHGRELDSAKRIAKAAGFKSRVLRIKLPWEGSALLDKKEKLPKRRKREIGKDIPPTYVPARNTVFLSYALSYAEAIGAQGIFIGANFVDYSGYPDCRPQFLRAFEAVIRKGTKAGAEGRRINIEAPLLFKTKAQIIKRGLRLKVPYEYTWSCYKGDARPCNVCDSCVIRRKGFREAGIDDPLKH